MAKHSDSGAGTVCRVTDWLTSQKHISVSQDLIGSDAATLRQKLQDKLISPSYDIRTPSQPDPALSNARLLVQQHYHTNSWVTVMFNSVKLNSWDFPSYHVARNTTCCTWWALDVLPVIFTRLCPGHSVRVGDGSRRSAEIVKISNCAFECDYYYYYYYYYYHYYHHHHHYCYYYTVHKKKRIFLMLQLVTNCLTETRPI